MSTQDTKPVRSLQIPDLEKHPIWQFVEEDETEDDTDVRPVLRLPVSDLTGKLVGSRVRLANGDAVWAIIGNLDNSTEQNELFVILSLEREGEWFFLARYFDHDYEERGPEALARFLGLSVDDVFPISYDVRQYLVGNPIAFAGSVLKEPRTRLTREQIIGRAIPKP